MIIKNGYVFIGERFTNKDLRICDGLVKEICEAGTIKPNDGEEIIDAKDKYVLPGLVEIHSHGRVGHDFNFANENEIEEMCISYAKCGVTSILGTTMTNAPDKIESAMKTIGKYRKEKHPGAKLIGINMEGPFLGHDKKGAHDERYLRPTDIAWFKEMQDLSCGSIKLVSIDPRYEQTEDFIKYCLANNVRVSLAHTGCDYETADKAAKAGADHVTHLFNAMQPLLHRAPGLVGCAFDNNMFSEIICDGIH
ncbi:MAG: amidohydrolase family protein, partial [Lachnospiraceae bacterium]|nr:amidohydrolase family protein [Lachnospiraceae bacterium]